MNRILIFWTLLSSFLLRVEGGDGFDNELLRNSETCRNQARYHNLDKLVCVDDFEKEACRILDSNEFAYFHDGADDQSTLRDNVMAYKRITLKPRVLTGVANRNLRTKIFGKSVEFPFGASPTALQKLADSDGEIASAKAAETMGTIFTLSILSNAKIEEVARAAPNARKWQNIFIFKNRSLTENIIRKAEDNGFEAIVITVDCPVLGLKRHGKRVPLVLPKKFNVANFGPEEGFRDGKDVFNRFNDLLDSTLTWKDIAWVKNFTKLRLVVKGIMNTKDAELAILHKVDGIIVSNHGGRQLDSVAASIDVLPEIIRQVAGRCVVIVDGGVRTGMDIFKALALGADMVFAGRPLLWGLAVDGEHGVKQILQILKDEFNRTMALAGVRKVSQITEAYIGRRAIQ